LPQPRLEKGGFPAHSHTAGLIDAGHQHLAARKYLDACDSFKAATDKALGLLPH
jgi:hypothetical protein